MPENFKEKIYDKLQRYRVSTLQHLEDMICSDAFEHCHYLWENTFDERYPYIFDAYQRHEFDYLFPDIKKLYNYGYCSSTILDNIEFVIFEKVRCGYIDDDEFDVKFKVDLLEEWNAPSINLSTKNMYEVTEVDNLDYITYNRIDYKIHQRSIRQWVRKNKLCLHPINIKYKCPRQKSYFIHCIDDAEEVLVKLKWF